MSQTSLSLPILGWSHFFQQQLSLEEWESTVPARVFGIHRNIINVASEHGHQTITLSGHWHLQDSEHQPTVGDWLLFDPSTGQAVKILERKNLFRRKAAGIKSKVQLLAAIPCLSSPLATRISTCRGLNVISLWLWSHRSSRYWC